MSLSPFVLSNQRVLHTGTLAHLQKGKTIMKLGWWDVCLNVQDLEKSRSFYEKLGLQVVEGNAEQGYWVMANDSARIGLYKGHIQEFVLNFRGGDVMANAEALGAKGLTFESGPTEVEGGGGSATLRDPDGNVIFLDTHPDELDPDYQKKIGVL